MNHTTRTLAAGLVIFAMAGALKAQDEPIKQWVWLNSQGVWGFGYQIQDGPHRGLWRVDPDSKRAPEEVVPVTDPYGFAAILNGYRAEAGLPPVAYDHELSAWAASNNAEQSSRGHGTPRQSQLLPELPHGTLPTPPAPARPGWSRGGTGRTCSLLQSTASASPTALGRTGP